MHTAPDWYTMPRQSVSLSDDAAAWVREEAGRLDVSQSRVIAACVDAARPDGRTDLVQSGADDADRLVEIERRLDWIESQLHQIGAVPHHRVHQSGAGQNAKESAVSRSGSDESTTSGAAVRGCDDGGSAALSVRERVAGVDAGEMEFALDEDRRDRVADVLERLREAGVASPDEIDDWLVAAGVTISTRQEMLRGVADQLDVIERPGPGQNRWRWSEE